MQKKMEPCQFVGSGGDAADTCPCPACTARRAATNIARMRASVVAVREDTKTAKPESGGLAPPKGLKTVTVAPPKPDEVREEERLRAQVKDYLLKDVPTTAWDDIVGAEEARTVLREALEAAVKHPDLYKHYGMRVPRGVLLEGAPGCGKTMFAKAAAHAMAELYSSGQPTMLRINGPEIQTPYVGATEKIIRDIFAYARAYAARYKAPLLIFVDEADAILPARDPFVGRQTQGWEESAVATFLTEMDGVGESGAFVLLATNRPQAMDAAILRPGRIDVKVRVPRPNREACARILAGALRGAPLALKHHSGAVPRGHMSYTQGGGPCAQAVDDLAGRAVDLLLSPVHVLTTMQSDKGPLHLTMAHIVSGAMVVELGNRARQHAFRRDLAADTITGLTEADCTAAVYALVQESERMQYPDAIRDMCMAAGATVAHNGPGDTPFDEDHLLPFQRSKKPKDSKPN